MAGVILQTSIGVADTGINSNSKGTFSESFHLHGHEIFTFCIKVASGDVTGLVVEVHCSPDDVNYYKMTKTLTFTDNENMAFTFGPMSVHSAKVCIATASTDASTIDIEVHAR